MSDIFDWEYIKTKLRQNGGALAFSGASQVISSLTNFGVVLYLVRVLQKEEFGMYSLGFSVYLILAAILAALFAVQYVVNNPDQPQYEQRIYALHHVAAMTLSCTGIVLLALFLKAVLDNVSFRFQMVNELIVPVALCTFSFAIRDMATRIAFVERKENIVMGSIITIAVITASMFFMTHSLTVPSSAMMGLVIIAMSQFAGAVYIMTRLRLPWSSMNVKDLRRAFIQSWQGGRWHALTSVVYSIRNQAHNFIVLPILGLAALAEINAARVLVTPALMVIPPLYQVAMPRLADIRKFKPNSFHHYILITTFSLIFFALVYSLILLLMVDTLLPLVLSSDYAGLGYLVIAWSAATIFMAARNGLSMGLEISRVFKNLLAVNVIAAFIVVFVTALLAKLWGNVGAIWGIALVEFMLCLMLFKLLLCQKQRSVNM